MEGVFSLSHSSVLVPTYRPITATTRISSSLNSPPPEPPGPNLRRPDSLKSSSPVPVPKFPSNPLKNIAKAPDVFPPRPTSLSHSLSSKLRLSSKLFPSIQEETPEKVPASEPESPPSEPETPIQFRQEGKIFVGNLPNWLKKHEAAEFFRQFGPIKNVILIKGHNEVGRNAGFGFVIYGGPTAERSALKAVEFDGVEFHGRVLTVKLDDGRRLKSKSEERARWVEGFDGEEHRSAWHEEREGSRTAFRKILETEPDNWQKVVSAFEMIKKPSRKEFGLMVNYYARRGDMHRARETFEGMRARGIEPTSHVYTNLIHAYSVGRDMEEALSCVRKMKEEGIEMTLVTYSIIVGGFGKIRNAEAAEYWFKEAKERHTTLNGIIYGNIIYAHCQTCNMERAEALVREMEEEGIDAPIDIYHTMMDGYTNIGNEEKCLMVFERLKDQRAS